MKILNTHYDNLLMTDALEKAFSLIKERPKVSIFFMNAHALHKSQHNSEYCNNLNNADLVLPDGIALKLATKISGGKMIDNCNGTDFSPLVLERAAKEGYKVFFLGGQEGVAGKAAENIRGKIPDIKIVGSHTGFFENKDDLVIDKINDSEADIVFVAMGVPVQEQWISKNRDKINAKMFLAVGAFLDFLSGKFKRAPKFFRVIHMEWLWRIIQEPKRLIKRYLFEDIRVFWKLLKQRLRKTE